MNKMGNSRMNRKTKGRTSTVSKDHDDEMGIVLLRTTKIVLAGAAFPVAIGVVSWLLLMIGAVSEEAVSGMITASLQSTFVLTGIAMVALVAFCGRWAYQSFKGNS